MNSDRKNERRESIYPETYGNTVVYSELQQAIPIPIQQNNLFSHFLSYSSEKATGSSHSFCF